MQRNHGDSKREDDGEDEEAGEEEVLSLCDLPLALTNRDEKDPPPAPSQSQQEDFEFGSSSLSNTPTLCPSKSHMRAADDLFFQGQIIPLRRLSSAAAGSDSFSSGTATSAAPGSSRSSSTRSSSSSRSWCVNPAAARASDPNRARPIPQPRIRIPRARSGSSRCRKATLWETLRLGLVRAPEIGFQDAKLRNSNSRNSGGMKNSDVDRSSKSIGSGRKSFDYGFLSGCRCSITAAQTPVPWKKTKDGDDGGIKGEEKEKHQRKPTWRSVSRRHRTFEWLQGLSIAEPLRLDEGDDDVSI